MREQLDRIEAKLDALLAALAQDEEPAGPTEDLDGSPDPINARRAREIDRGTL
jgi:hypothetical protein